MEDGTKRKETAFPDRPRTSQSRAASSGVNLRVLTDLSPKAREHLSHRLSLEGLA